MSIWSLCFLGLCVFAVVVLGGLFFTLVQLGIKNWWVIHLNDKLKTTIYEVLNFGFVKFCVNFILKFIIFIVEKTSDRKKMANIF